LMADGSAYGLLFWLQPILFGVTVI